MKYTQLHLAEHHVKDLRVIEEFAQSLKIEVERLYTEYLERIRVSMPVYRLSNQGEIVLTSELSFAFAALHLQRTDVIIALNRVGYDFQVVDNIVDDLSPLAYCAKENKYAALRCLLDLGYDPTVSVGQRTVDDEVIDDEMYPIFFAAEKGYLAISKAIFEASTYDFDPESMDCYGNNLLHYAARAPFNREAMLYYFKAQGCSQGPNLAGKYYTEELPLRDLCHIKGPSVIHKYDDKHQLTEVGYYHFSYAKPICADLLKLGASKEQPLRLNKLTINSADGRLSVNLLYRLIQFMSARVCPNRFDLAAHRFSNANYNAIQALQGWIKNHILRNLVFTQLAVATNEAEATQFALNDFNPIIDAMEAGGSLASLFITQSTAYSRVLLTQVARLAQVGIGSLCLNHYSFKGLQQPISRNDQQLIDLHVKIMNATCRENQSVICIFSDHPGFRAAYQEACFKHQIQHQPVANFKYIPNHKKHCSDKINSRISKNVLNAYKNIIYKPDPFSNYEEIAHKTTNPRKRIKI